MHLHCPGDDYTGRRDQRGRAKLVSLCLPLFPSVGFATRRFALYALLKPSGSTNKRNTTLHFYLADRTFKFSGTAPLGMATQSGADAPGAAPHSAHDELNNEEGLQRILRELCVPPAMHQALRAQGICCIADFAYAYNSTADLDNFATSKDDEFWAALQVTEQPLHSMPMARLRRALVQAQIRVKAYEAEKLRTEEPASQSSAPSSSTAPPADSWVEHAPRRLDNDTVAKLTAEFKEAYPGGAPGQLEHAQHTPAQHGPCLV